MQEEGLRILPSPRRSWRLWAKAGFSEAPSCDQRKLGKEGLEAVTAVPEPSDWFEVAPSQEWLRPTVRIIKPGAYVPEFDFEPTNPDGYAMPPVDAQAEVDSLNYQAKSFNHKPPPSKKVIKEVLSRAELAWTKARFNVREDFGSVAHVKEVVEQVRDFYGTKSPGAIYIRQGFSKNSDVFDALGVDEIVRLTMERLDEYAAGGRYTADPIRIFIKFEPHKASKIQTKRWRLIWGVSLIDNIAARVIYREMLYSELDNWSEVPSKIGLGFMNGSTAKLFNSYDPERPNGSRKWRSFDCKSFDFSVPGWMFDMNHDLSCRLNLDIDTPQGKRWEKCARGRVETMKYGRFCLSNGVVCKKTKPGIQASGDLLTASNNSRAITMSRMLYDVENGNQSFQNDVGAMGDDTIQDKIEDAEHFVAWEKEHYGITLTTEAEAGQLIEQNFCSHEFTTFEGTVVPVPTNWTKMSYSMAHPEKIGSQTEALLSACVEYRFHPKFELLHALLKKPEHVRLYRSAELIANMVTGYESSANDQLLCEGTRAILSDYRRSVEDWNWCGA